MNEKWFLCFCLPFVGLLFTASKASAQGAGLRISSPAFVHNTMIPSKYTCQGEDISPPLEIAGVPAGTQTMILIVDDPDAPMGTWDHWLLYDIPPTTTSIKENTIPGVQTYNSFGKANYGGPCPPSGTHRYFFKLYALDLGMVDFKRAPTKKELESMMRGHILAYAELIGLYKKR